MSDVKTAVIIGNGNVGSHLGTAFPKIGITVLQIANSSTPLSELNIYADIYIIAVKDDAIEGVYNELVECLQKCRNNRPFSENKIQLIVHTSGGRNQFTPPSDVLIRTGVLYFVQSFTKDFPLDFSQIPICIEAQDTPTELLLFDFAKNISTQVEIIDSQKRGSLHLAAVFANNFGNLLFGTAQDILKDAELPIHLLDALILETALKATKMKTAWEAQTGPALRQDIKTMKRHKELLCEKNEDIQKIYDILSEMIRAKNINKKD